jgi:hypothetical protein
VALERGIEQEKDEANGMRINPNVDRTVVTGIQAGQAAAPKPVATGEDAVPCGPQQLQQALKALPGVRTDKVARAKELVRDSTYPSDQILAQVAGVLAAKLKHSDPLR